MGNFVAFTNMADTSNNPSIPYVNGMRTHPTGVMHTTQTVHLLQHNTWTQLHNHRDMLLSTLQCLAPSQIYIYIYTELYIYSSYTLIPRPATRGLNLPFVGFGNPQCMRSKQNLTDLACGACGLAAAKANSKAKPKRAMSSWTPR